MNRFLRFGLFIGLAAITATRSAHALAPELNVPGFASCLALIEPVFTPEDARAKYGLDQSSIDTLLPYLAFYPGQRWPVANELVQKKGFALWGTRFDSQAAVLANSLAALSAARVVPVKVFELALATCGHEDIFCAAISAHNVLRTLGRYPQAVSKDKITGQIHDYNPDWFKDRRDYWLGEIPLIKNSLIPLRRGPDEDQFGEWYHFFGIFTYALAVDTAYGNLTGASEVVLLNRLATLFFTGKEESPEKAQVDQDSVNVSQLYVKGAGGGALLDCSSTRAYVNSGRFR